MPAQQTTMSSPPKASSARSTTPRPPAMVATLSGLATACPPAAWISLTTESAGALHRLPAAAGHGGPAVRARHRLPACRLDLLDHGVGGRARRLAPVHAHTVVVDDHTCARACQPQRDRAADAAARARHRRDFSLEERHTRIG